MKTVLVTGATGFIGQHLCAALLQRGLTLRLLGRRPADYPADFFQWDMRDELNSEVLQGVDTVFHLAGKAHALTETRQDEDEYFRINTSATKQLLEAAKKAGVHTFVYFSSVKAAGDVDGLMDESVNAMPDTPYGESKLAAEKLVIEGGFVAQPVVIRPAMVYGNTDKGNLPKMIRAVQAGRFPPLPEFGNQRSMLHVDDVVAAAILAAEQPRSAGEIYIVTDGQLYSTRQMYEWICEALCKAVPAWYLPQPVLKLLGVMGDVIGSLRGRRFVFDSDALHKLSGSASYSSEKISRDLGFAPQRGLREALPEITHFLEAIE